VAWGFVIASLNKQLLVSSVGSYLWIAGCFLFVW